MPSAQKSHRWTLDAFSLQFQLPFLRKKIKIKKMKDRPKQHVNTHAFFLSVYNWFSRTLCRVFSLKGPCGFWCLILGSSRYCAFWRKGINGLNMFGCRGYKQPKKHEHDDKCSERIWCIKKINPSRNELEYPKVLQWSHKNFRKVKSKVTKVARGHNAKMAHSHIRDQNSKQLQRYK